MATPELPEKLEFLLNYDTGIIELILQNLYLKDLANAGLVSKTWNNVANKLKKDTNVQISTNNYNAVKSETYFQNKISLPEHVQPKLALTFMDFGVYDRHWYFLEENYGGKKGLNKLPKYKKSNVHLKLKDSLPETCSSVLMQRPSALIKYYDATTSEPEKLLGYVTFGFPDIPGANIQSFEIDTESKKLEIPEIVRLDFKIPIKHVILMLCSKPENFGSRIKKILAYIESNQSEPFTYSIYVFEALYHSQDCKFETDYIKAITFSGANFELNSVSIDPQFKDTEQADVNASIGELRSRLQTPCFRHNSFALMFGFNFSVKLVEMIDEYKKHFPETPLIGVICEGAVIMDPINRDKIELLKTSGAELHVMSWH